LVAELIRRKRDGGELSGAEIEELVSGITDGSVTDAQIGALAMAIVWRGMSREERVALTGAMMRSGEVLEWHGASPGRAAPGGKAATSAGAPVHGEWADLDRPALDKHSTGGVGDKVSLLLAPIVAACGGAVPMISGRGLGHTGGTLDKLESIPGYDVVPTPARFREVVTRTGCAIIGQTAALAPADRRLYAIRDATATVESLPLIVASILSKKLAAGLDALVMDVKAGSGAFLPDLDDTRELAAAIVEVARGNGLATSALITDMDQVLGRTAGNAVEVRESIDILTGSGTPEPRLLEVTLALSAELLVLGGLHDEPPAARAAAEHALSTGAAADVFAAMVAALGGPAKLLEAPGEFLPHTPIARPVEPLESGVVTHIDVRAVGIGIVALGGGRARETDSVDHAVGLTDVAALGEAVGPGARPLAILHARDEASFERATATLRAAYTLGDAWGGAGATVLEVLR
jgi:thymidine phosphorylase